MLLNKPCLQVAKFASDEGSRYASNIEVTPDRVTATNGHYLASVTLPESFKSDCYPVTEGLEHKNEKCLVSAESALIAAKNLPNKNSLPVLGCAAVGTDNKLYINDLEQVKSFESNPESGTFPNWDVIVPKDEPAIQIVVNAEYLERIALYVRQHSESDTKPVRMTIYKADGCMRFDANVGDGQQAMFLLMPIRPDSVSFATLPQAEKKQKKVA